MNAIDTNIFIYAADRAEPAKQGLAERLLDRLMERSDETLLLWQVAVELLAHWRKCKNRGTVTETQVRNYMQHDANYDGVSIINPFL